MKFITQNSQEKKNHTTDLTEMIIKKKIINVPIQLFPSTDIYIWTTNSDVASEDTS